MEVLLSLKLNQRIGTGKSSIVYAVQSPSDDTAYCLKMEPIASCDQLLNEIQVLPELHGCVGVPDLVCHGMFL
jgi:hypothetical protein